MITHRNAPMNVVGTLLHLPVHMTDRYLWTMPMFHANGWTYTWTVTAAGGAHVCLRKVELPNVFDLLDRERITMLCSAPTVLIAIASAPRELRARAPKGVQVVTAGAPPAAATTQRIQHGLRSPIPPPVARARTAPVILLSDPRA